VEPLVPRRVPFGARSRAPIAWVLPVLALGGCGGGPSAIATSNRTFYDWAVPTESGGAKEFEERYPPLDLAQADPFPEYLGVTVLRRGIHLSKPRNWILRNASNQPGQAFVDYISPNAYSVAIYERPESPVSPWLDLMKRFEDDTQSLGAKISGQRVPVATGLGQGRAYDVTRNVEAAKSPLVSRSREYLVRGKTRVVLVQIVYEGEDLSLVNPELLRVVDTLEVL
jgi:hypothetical protein